MMMHVCRLTSALLLCAFGFSAAACGRQGGIGPDVFPSAMLESRPLMVSATVPVAGSFTITTTQGDQIVGAFTELSTTDAAGRETFSLEMTVSGGSGAFAFAAGTLVGEGKGAGANVGSFSLRLTGTITFPLTGGEMNLKMTSHGTTSCVGQFLTMRGDGALPMFGRAVVELRDNSVSAACI